MDGQGKIIPMAIHSGGSIGPHTRSAHTRAAGKAHVGKREWIISHFEPNFELKVGDYPLSFIKRPIIHARVSIFPRSCRRVGNARSILGSRKRASNSES